MDNRSSFFISLYKLFLLVLLCIGLFFRFNWVNWSQGASLHPDEYGLTNTLTRLQLPDSLDGYFNTRLSPLSPYPQYDLSGNKLADGPDNRMRWGQWPMILIRAAAELTGNTGYNELRLLGRTLSALVDSISVLLIFFIGRRLYNEMIGLHAAALSALAVMQIQQAHFMTVDNYGVVFTMLAMYTCVRIAQRPGVRRFSQTAVYRMDMAALPWYLLFGLSFGMALASKINLAPLAGMVALAAILSVLDVKLRFKQDLRATLAGAALFLAASGLVALVAFRLAQPMSFRAASGDTDFFTLQLNSDWVESMKVAQSESSGLGGGPPAEQWAHRPRVLFPWLNMVLWGMGIPLGLMCWAGFLGAAWLAVKEKENWRNHLLPLVWTGGYFLFMGTRWVMSVRYFLPIYPFLCLFAAWGLARLWQGRPQAGETTIDPSARASRQQRGLGRCLLVGILAGVVTLGALAWAVSFVNAVYRQDHTRVQATLWIFENIPAPFHLVLQDEQGQTFAEPLAGRDRLWVTQASPVVTPFIPSEDGRLSEIILPHVAMASPPGVIRMVVSTDTQGFTVLDEVELTVSASLDEQPGPQASGRFQGAQLQAGQTYYLIATTSERQQVIQVSRSVIANESWDEGLPFYFKNLNPFGQLYSGLSMEIRWYDNPDKRQMILDTLAQTDYLILPSQRGIWSTCRLPRTYPMTMEYYRALFNGQLGFELAAEFQSPLRLGPLQISDVGGTAAWNRAPDLPLFNRSLLAAEEAFSVYDHPPVWIFKKRADFNLASVQQVLDRVDLSQVVVESPSEATGDYCR